VHRYEPDFLLFASDALLYALWGGAFIAVALLALFMDRRRTKRAGFGSVGWFPWTSLFMLSALVGGALLFVAAPAAMGG